MTKQKHRKRRVRDRAAKTGESYAAALRHVRSKKEEPTVPTIKEETATPTDEQVLGCTFCGKSHKQVQRLVAGPGVYICDKCVGLCNTILEVEGDETPHASVDQVVEVLKTMDLGHEPTIHWAALCRKLGATWDQIGDAVGLSAADAQRRLNVED
jgi:hypothetical protein